MSEILESSGNLGCLGLPKDSGNFVRRGEGNPRLLQRDSCVQQSTARRGRGGRDLVSRLGIDHGSVRRWNHVGKQLIEQPTRFLCCHEQPPGWPPPQRSPQVAGQHSGVGTPTRSRSRHTPIGSNTNLLLHISIPSISLAIPDLNINQIQHRSLSIRRTLYAFRRGAAKSRRRIPCEAI
ncbi:hypothetical protein SASPL_155766 [Salvia splendens]|uniref:Uncharacterized protein n=1 Tax=Salvia splendens TaxID=180675 RepID=A0A8X8YYQ0_SALSN|nr:hypothetical protein SASPL_155766 [Salvia splendens]